MKPIKKQHFVSLFQIFTCYLKAASFGDAMAWELNGIVESYTKSDQLCLNLYY